jgi:hypothetical protein
LALEVEGYVLVIAPSTPTGTRHNAPWLDALWRGFKDFNGVGPKKRLVLFGDLDHDSFARSGMTNKDHDSFRGASNEPSTCCWFSYGDFEAHVASFVEHARASAEPLPTPMKEVV